jgi:hypothetical protein
MDEFTETPRIPSVLLVGYISPIDTPLLKYVSTIVEHLILR